MVETADIRLSNKCSDILTQRINYKDHLGNVSEAFYFIVWLKLERGFAIAVKCTIGTVSCFLDQQYKRQNRTASNLNHAGHTHHHVFN